MLGLGQTVADLARHRRRWQNLMNAAAEAGGLGADIGAPAGRLAEVTGFGSNPGNLRMLAYVPEDLPASAPLVMVLHGCTQTAGGYDLGAGWSTLADRYGFALLLPEQQRANNPQGCFNWFQPGHIARGRGEALSIRQMVERMVSDHGLDRRRVFVTGLSAGGAMAGVMLATYPDVFAGGAILAGLPYGCASNVQEALECMYQGPSRPAREWGELVRAASPHKGPWPKVSVWHGSADTTVVPQNAEEIVKQWTDVHGLAPAPTREDRVDGVPRRVWRNAAGENVIEAFTVDGMAHGTPIAPDRGEAPHGSAAPFILDVGIASSYHIAKFWGLTEGKPRAAAEASRESRTAAGAGIAAEASSAGRGRYARESAAGAQEDAQAADAFRPTPADRATDDAGSSGRRTALPIDPHAVITKALGAAGLLKGAVGKILGRR